MENVIKRLRGMEDGVDLFNIGLIGVLEGEKDYKEDVLFEKIMDRNFLEFVKDIKL